MARPATLQVNNHSLGYTFAAHKLYYTYMSEPAETSTLPTKGSFIHYPFYPNMAATQNNSVHLPFDPNGSNTISARYRRLIPEEEEELKRQVKNHQSSSSSSSSSSSLLGCSNDLPRNYFPSLQIPPSAAAARGEEAAMIEEQMEKLTISQKPPKKCHNIPLRWSKIRKGIRRKKVIFMMGRSISQSNQKRISSKVREHPWKDIDSLIQNNICSSGCTFAYLRGQNRQQDSRIQNEAPSSTSISEKYEPKLFEDIAGHEIIIKAICSAVQNKKIVHPYLFHGPSGTGKTSTAKIFARSLNCESTSHAKPCWSCRGCSRSLCIVEFCSRGKTTGFDRIRTFLQSTSFTQTFPGCKVMIIEGCNSLSAEAWDELWGIMNGSGVVFLLITVDVNMVPRTVSSRCQKFFFPKLMEIDVMLKLARILAKENIPIEGEALKLIIVKAEGSLREAENLLDQLCSLGTKITTSMVQQLVGLISHDKLVDLLATAISGDNLKTVRVTRELIATGVEPEAFVSQLISLITDIIASSAVAHSDSSSLAGPSDKRLLRSGSHITNTQSERFCHALKILVETEKQPKSTTDQTPRIYAALLQIASEDVSNRISTGIVLPRDRALSSGDKLNEESVDLQRHRQSHSRSHTNHQFISQASEKLGMDGTDTSKITKSINQTKRSKGKSVEREPNLACISDMEEFWLNTLKRIQSKYVKEFLSRQVKLASLTISSATAIVHLTFKRPKDKLAAQMSEDSITRALEDALGHHHVTLNMSLETVDPDIIQEDSFSSAKNQPVNASHSSQQQRAMFLTESIYSRSRSTGDPMRHSTHKKSVTHSEGLKLIELKDGKLKFQGQDKHPREKESTRAHPQKMLPYLVQSKRENRVNTSKDAEIKTLSREWATINKSNIMKNNRRRWLSLSSIQQSDASVEAYSQDILFENAKIEKECGARRNPQHQKGFSEVDKDHEFLDSATGRGLRRSWSCTELFCRKTKVGIHGA